MNFDWQDFLLLARYLNGEIVSRDLTLAKYRSAISRAYYAAYNISKIYLENYCKVDFNSDKLKTIKSTYKVEGHGVIGVLMLSSDNAQIRVCGSKFKNLISKRVQSDYLSENIENMQVNVRDAIKNADKIISSLELLKEGKASVDLQSLSRL